MSNYTPSTNFATKDALPSGDPLKIVKGTEINTEFVNIQTAIATKLDITSLYPIGSIYINATDGTNPGSLFGFGTWSAFGAGRVPVGFDSTNAMFDTASETGGSYDAVVVAHTHTGTTGTQSANHAHTGTTDAIGDHAHSALGNNTNGRFTATGAAGGEFTATQTTGAAGAHTHTFTTGANNANHNHSFTTASSGVSATNANVQPYITVYMWRRTA